METIGSCMATSLEFQLTQKRASVLWWFLSLIYSVWGSIRFSLLLNLHEVNFGHLSSKRKSLVQSWIHWVYRRSRNWLTSLSMLNGESSAYRQMILLMRSAQVLGPSWERLRYSLYIFDMRLSGDNSFIRAHRFNHSVRKYFMQRETTGFP